MEGLLHTYYTDNMCAQMCKDDAEHAIALISVDPKEVQSVNPSTWLHLKVLLRTLFFLMLALSLVLCVVSGHNYGEHHAQNVHIEEHLVDQPRGLDGHVLKQDQRIDAVVAPGNLEVLGSQRLIYTPDSAASSRISKKDGQKLHASSKTKMSSFVNILEDLLREELLKLHQKILCLDAHADKEVAALKERGFKDVQGINLLPALLNSKHMREISQRKKLAHQNFDFFFTTMFDRSPYPAQFVAEIEHTLNVGGFAAMHVSLNKWRNMYIASKAGHSIKPVTLLFQHSEIVYVSSAYAPGLDTIIVFKKTTNGKEKPVDQTEVNKKQLHDNRSMPQLIKLSTEHKSRKYAEDQQLKSSQYIPESQGTREAPHVEQGVV